MRLLSPLALLYIPLVALVLLLARRHIVRARRTVATLFLWHGADPQRLQPTVRLRLRRRLLLLIQACLLLSLVFALAQPSLTLSRPRVAFLIDTSASMGARQQGGTRLDAARQRAEETARTLLAGTGIDLWSEDLSAPVASGVDQQQLRSALPRLTTIDGPVDIAAGVAAIRAASGPWIPIVVFSDAVPVDLGDAHLRWNTVGEAVPNVAITSLAARQLREPAAVTEVVVGIHNFGDQDVEAPFELERDGKAIATERPRVRARSMTTATLRLPVIDAVIISARLLNADALVADNVRYAVIPQSSRDRALLITSGNFFLERALRSISSVDLDIAEPDESHRTDGYDFVVCDGCEGASGTLPTLVLPSGPSSGESEPLRLVAANHPLARFIQASGLRAVPTTGERLLEGSNVIARAGNLPALVAFETPGRRLVELRVDLRQSPFVLTPAFPILISNAVAWLTREGENASALVAGETLRWTVPGAPDVSVRGPDGAAIPASLHGGHVSTASIVRAGIYDIRLGDRPHPFVVNPATDTESDLAMPRFSVPPSAPLPSEGAREASALAVPLLIVALVFLAAEAALSRPVSFGARVFRLTIAVGIAAAATAPRIPWGAARQDVMFVLDRSASMSSAAEAKAVSAINNAARTMRRGDRAGLIVFGADAAVEKQLGPDLRLATITSRTRAAATNVEAALRLARQELRSSGLGRVVVLSDGHETTGNSAAEAARAATDGVQIDVLPLDTDSTPLSAVVNGLSAPARVRAGEPFALTTEVEGRPGARVDVELRRDGESIASTPVTLAEDGTASRTFSDVQRAAGLHTYTAAVRISGLPDALPEAGTVVTVTDRPSLLYVADDLPTLLPVFEAAEWRVQRASVTSLPADASALERYDAIVLEGVKDDDVSSIQAAALANYVRNDGGGLLVVGGDWRPNAVQSSVASLLPVDFRPRSGSRSPGIALVLAFDKSGSMADGVGGVSKIELARQSVLGALQAIPPADLFGVIAFDSRPQAIAPLAAAHDVGAVARKLRNLDAAGATSIAPALDLAETWLRASGVAKRRVLLVSDGRTAPTDVARLRDAVHSRQFELSVVAIGDDADRPLLTSLAEESGGRAYFPSDVSDLPKIVSRDAAASTSGTVVHESFTAQIVEHAVTRGIDPGKPPVFGGYTVGAAKSGAESMVVSHLSDPLLAGWRNGLGRVAVFASDLQTPSMRRFMAWPAFERLWAQTARWVSRQAESSTAVMELEPTQQGLRMRLAFEPATGERRIVHATASLRGPNETVSVPLVATSPGRLEGVTTLSDEGTYVASVAVGRADGSDERILQGAYWAPGAEIPAPADRTLLASIAAVTGGRVLTDRDSPFNGVRPGEPTNVGPLLTNLVMLALLIEIARQRGLLAPHFWRRPPSTTSRQQVAA